MTSLEHILFLSDLTWHLGLQVKKAALGKARGGNEFSSIDWIGDVVMYLTIKWSSLQLEFRSCLVSP
jgi:hypothetical protein